MSKIEVCMNGTDWIEVNKNCVKKMYADEMKRLLIIVDESSELLMENNVKTDAGKQEDAEKAEIAANLQSIAQLGRSSSINLILTTQRAEAKVISGNLKNNLGMRIMCGRGNPIASIMAFDSTIGTTIDNSEKGSGMTQVSGGDVTRLRYYYDEFPWLLNYFKLRGLDEHGYGPHDFDGKADESLPISGGTVDLKQDNEKAEFEFDHEKSELDHRQDQKFTEL